MKKLVALVLCAMLLIGLVPVAAAASDTFTLMIYLCGTDLESKSGAASADLREMVSTRISNKSGLTVYIQTGGTKSWQTRGITQRKAERWVLTQSGMQQVDGPFSADMGDEATLTEFLKYGFENYPADRYGLIMWDHGSGATGGLCYDEMTRDSLFYPEIYNALDAAIGGKKNRKFEFVGFDACLMASYEMAVHLMPFAKYMIASEELEPGTGWDYSAWLPSLAADPGISTTKLGKQIVDSFISHSTSSSFFGSRDYATLSVCNLTKMPPLVKAVEAMGSALDDAIANGDFATISRLRQNMRSFGDVYNSSSDMIDVSVFADVYGRYDSTAANDVKAALDDVVVYSRHTTNLSNISGLSILVPYATRSASREYLPNYDAMGLTPNYAGFVSSMLSTLSSGSGGSSLGGLSIGQQTIEQAQIDWFSQYSLDQGSYESSAGSLWEALYGSDTSTPSEDFSLDSFLSAILGGDGAAGYDSSYDSSTGSLWGDLTGDTSFTIGSGFNSSDFAYNDWYSTGADSLSGTIDPWGSAYSWYGESTNGFGGSTATPVTPDSSDPLGSAYDWYGSSNEGFGGTTGATTTDGSDPLGSAYDWYGNTGSSFGASAGTVAADSTDPWGSAYDWYGDNSSAFGGATATATPAPADPWGSAYDWYGNSGDSFGYSSGDDSIDSLLSSLFGFDLQPTSTPAPSLIDGTPILTATSDAQADNADTPTDATTVTVQTGDGSVTLDNPFGDIDSEYAYTLQLTPDQLSSLGKVEATLMLDVSDPDFECYVELGYVQDVIVDWNRGSVYGLFDGTWATLDGQMVPLYDQIANDRYVRSLVPVTVNGDPSYLLVIFDEQNPHGVVTGYTDGYTEAGLPSRAVYDLKRGDVVVPQYELIYWNNGVQQSEPFEGDPITVDRSGTIPFGFEPVESDADYAYGFCLTDIYGDQTYSDYVYFSY